MAVGFLVETKIRPNPVAKKIAFLRSKGWLIFLTNLQLRYAVMYECVHMSCMCTVLGGLFTGNGVLKEVLQSVVVHHSFTGKGSPNMVP